jgi:hypothetical protein
LSTISPRRLNWSKCRFSASLNSSKSAAFTVGTVQASHSHRKQLSPRRDSWIDFAGQVESHEEKTGDYHLDVRLKTRYFLGMRSFLTYLSERRKWASKGTGGVCGWVSLIVGATLAILIWFSPQWFHDHISDRMIAFVLVMVPLLAGASVFLGRWFVSPYPTYM